MFTGIIETLGKVISISKKGTNKAFTISSTITSELKIDQSVSHNGVCLTVIATKNDAYTVEAIEETLKRSNLGKLKANDTVNLERSMLANGRIDGHFVQGHVDTTAQVLKVENRDGSWLYTFELGKKDRTLVVEKGSVAINGVSLTVSKANKKDFSVAIIPYTYEHTNFNRLKKGDKANIEFDILGKYIQRKLDI